MIEQAKGVLAERADIEVSEAFSLLRGYSQLHGRPLSGVAAEVVAGSIAPEEVASGAVRPNDGGEA